MRTADYLAIQNKFLLDNFSTPASPAQVVYSDRDETIWVIVRRDAGTELFECNPGEDFVFYFHAPCSRQVVVLMPTPELVAAHEAYSLNPED